MDPTGGSSPRTSSRAKGRRIRTRLNVNPSISNARNKGADESLWHAQSDHLPQTRPNTKIAIRQTSISYPGLNVTLWVVLVDSMGTNVIQPRWSRASNSTLSSPPAFLNSGRHPSHSKSSTDHGTKTTVRLLSLLVCAANRARHLSTSFHTEETGISSQGFDPRYLKVMEERAGAERTKERKDARRAERGPELVSISMVVRTRNGGRCAGGCRASCNINLTSLSISLLGHAILDQPRTSK